MKTAILVDFEDSFTYNILQELRTTGFRVQIIDWREFKSNLKADLLVLGPGPGHPVDYSQIFPLIHDAFQSYKKILGVCLGHQLIWHLRGHKIAKSIQPMHGQKFLVPLDEDWQLWLGRGPKIWVQRYNSLVVKMNELPPEVKGIISNGELVMSRFQNVITYQFHPESLGTKCRQSFFRPIFLDIL